MLAGLGPDRRLLFRGVKHVVALWATVLFALPALVQTREDDNAANPGVVGQPVFLNSVHVGAAVQDQSQLKLRYEPFRGAYIRPLFLSLYQVPRQFHPRNHSGPHLPHARPAPGVRF